jgi:hypothetical protein
VRQRLRAGGGTVGHVQGQRALVREVARGELAHLPRAQQQHGAALQAAEDLPRQLHPGVGDGHGEPPQLGLAADLLGHREGLGEQRVQHRPHRLAGLREREGVLHLAQDLRLAHHHRVEAGRHAERVTDGLVLQVRVQVRLDLGQRHAALRAEAREDRGAGLAGHVGDAVDLHAVAGGHHHRLAQRPAHQLGEQLAQLVVVERELLAQLHGSAAMAQPGHEQRGHQEPCRPWASAPAPSVRSSTPKPAMAK